MADWDADDFDPDADGKLSVPKVTDKWDGEDEDDDIKDAWDAESEEERDDSQKEETVVKVKKKKTLAQKIAEKEEAAAKALEERMAREAEEKALNTPQGKLEEKLRLQKLQEENDLKLAADMLGLGVSSGGVIDGMNPTTKEEFENLTKAITDKVNNFDSSELYQDFVEDLVKNLCMGLTCQTLKKCKTHVEAFHSAKLKEEKAAKDKSKKGKTEKKSLKMDSATGYYDGYDDMDDFM